MCLLPCIFYIPKPWSTNIHYIHMSLYELCEIYSFSREYDKIKHLFSSKYSKVTDYSQISENECKELRNILEDLGSGELVDIFVGTFGSLPPRGRRDELWTTIAARLGSVSMLEAIHKYGFEVDEINDFSGEGIGKETPLSAGIFDESVVSYLLSKGAYPYVHSFGYYVSHPETYKRNILKLIWDKDPEANEHGVLRAFVLKSKTGVEWFKENGAKFSDRNLLGLACENLWADMVIFLIKTTFLEKDLITETNGICPLKMASATTDPELYCNFLDELMPQLLAETIKAVYLIPKSNENGTTTLPCGHEFNNLMRRAYCPLCAQPKYKIKIPCSSFCCCS